MSKGKAFLFVCLALLLGACVWAGWVIKNEGFSAREKPGELETYLARHAQRAHPQRDRQTGRLQLGLEPLCGSYDAAEIKEAA